MATIKKSERKVFSEAQNGALRSALSELKERKGLSQAGVGEMLGIKQQNVGRLLNEGGGFSYPTATALVRALGYASVDTFFRTKQVAA